MRKVLILLVPGILVLPFMIGCGGGKPREISLYGEPIKKMSHWRTIGGADQIADKAGGISRYDYELSSDDLPVSLVPIYEQIKSGKPKKALRQLKKWSKAQSESWDMDYALYLKGQALSNRKLYYQAIEAYEELLDKHAASKLFNPSLYKELQIAHMFLTGTKRKVWGFIPASARTEGISILEKIVDRWPGSNVAGVCLMMQADYYFDIGRYLEAQHTYQIIIDSYKENSYYERALLSVGEATHAQYRGPEYDPTCLSDAYIRYCQYQLRYPEKAQQVGIAGRLQMLREQQGENEYLVGDFYQRTKKFEAADYYWSIIADQWQDTHWSQLAQVRQEQQDLAEVPSEYETE